MQLLSDGIQPKWAKDFILGELKPLFLRTRHLDNSKKNQILQDFLSTLFPSFSKNHPERLVALAIELRKSWSNWRNVLWKKISVRYAKYLKDSCNESKNNLSYGEKISSYLKSRYISEIFDTWLKHTSSKLSDDDEKMLKDLVIFGFYCMNHPEKAHDKFFSFTGNLYTINCNFPSTHNTVTSMDLSQYEIILEIKSPDNSDSDEENYSKKRLKQK